ncbi:MAG: MXAN_5808 family serine peptidase [Pseudomonadota bacterium]
MKIKSRLIRFSLLILAGYVIIWSQQSSSITHAEIPQFPLVSKSLFAVERNYLDKDRLDAKQMLKGALEQVELRVPEILANFDDNSVLITVDMASKKFSLNRLNSLDKLEKTLKEILDFINTHYNGDIEKDEIQYVAIHGMLATLDPHSAFLSPDIFKEFRVGTKGEFGGLGIVISIKDGELTVIAPLDGTPASRSGIKAGDKIVQIDDESTINMSLTDAVNRLRGKIGSKVKLIIKRTGRTGNLSFLLTRALINIDSVQHDIIQKDNKKFGYLKVKSFQSNTDQEVQAALKALQKNGKLDGIILDVRNNPGGLLNQAVELADVFLNKGVIVSTVGRKNELIDVDKAAENKFDLSCPVVVLINEGSASASEIVAGSLKELDRAIVLGHKSFGKGSVQGVFEVGPEAAIKLTIAKYLPAGTYSIQSVGLTPDIEMIPITVDLENMNLLEDKIYTERDLEKFFAEEGRQEKAVYRVKFAQPKEESDIEAARKKEYAKKPELEDDFAVELATKILETVTDPSREKMLAEIKELIPEVGSAQTAKISASLKELGVDWEDVQSAGEPELKVAYNILKGDQKIKEINAGDEVELELKVTNIGKKAYGRLIGLGKSDSALLNDKEFIFGKLLPGQTNVWKNKIKVPEYFPTEELEMEVVFQSKDTVFDKAVNVIVPIKQPSQPIFAFQYKLSRVQLQDEQRFILNLEVKNIGAGSSDKETIAILAIKDHPEVFLEKGRVALDILKPKEQKLASFKFRVPSRIDAKTLPLEIMVYDSKYASSLTQKVELSPATGELIPSGGVLYQAPEINLAAYPVSTPLEQIDLEGMIKDNESVHDYYVYQGDKKVAYFSNPEQSLEIPFKVKLNLEPGNNIVLIFARDNHNLVAKKLVAINRTTGEKKEKGKLDVMPLIPGVNP